MSEACTGVPPGLLITTTTPAAPPSAKASASTEL